MKLSDMRHRITIQRFVTATDSAGFEVQEWQDYATVWAAASNLFGKEYFAAAAVQAENTVKFTIRYLDDMDTSMRIIFQGKEYDLKGIDNIKYRNQYIEIKAQKTT